MGCPISKVIGRREGTSNCLKKDVTIFSGLFIMAGNPLINAEERNEWRTFTIKKPGVIT
jgi:hypothetical protein